jgi:hypothetical protein
MKIALVTLLFAASAVAQDPSAALKAACGSDAIGFNVRLDDSQHALAQPEFGKAKVYFIQDKGPEPFGIGAKIQTRMGLDGTWVGSNRNNSYFSVSVEPGEHHLCADLHSVMGNRAELAHFRAEAGKVYYFRVRAVPTSYGVYLFFSPVDSDEARLLIAFYPLSVSQARK